jgi:pyridoxal phosphate enzyme (YggS family)
VTGPIEDRVGEALAVVRSRIDAACDRSGRDPEEVRLVAVVKAVPVDVVRAARRVGIDHFGENYANELATKASVVAATWHFLGKVQYGTAARVVAHADVIHSAEPGRGLPRVARRAARSGREIPCLIQVDFTGRRQGTRPEEVEGFVHELDARGIGGVRVVGLMTLPPWSADPEATRPVFAELRRLRDRLGERWPGLTELSMGMSADYHVAVEEGATMVRVGTALFGVRPGGGVPGGQDAP